MQHTHTQRHMRARMPMQDMHACTPSCTRIYAYTRAHACTHIHTCTYMHAHARTCMCMRHTCARMPKQHMRARMPMQHMLCLPMGIVNSKRSFIYVGDIAFRSGIERAHAESQIDRNRMCVCACACVRACVFSQRGTCCYSATHTRVTDEALCAHTVANSRVPSDTHIYIYVYIYIYICIYIYINVYTFTYMELHI